MLVVTPHGIHVPGYSRWFFNFIQRLLTNDRAILSLMGKNPFPDAPPAFVRALFYRYRYTTPEQKRQTGAWWSRQLLGIYLPPMSIQSLKVLIAVLPAPALNRSLSFPHPIDDAFTRLNP